MDEQPDPQHAPDLARFVRAQDAGGAYATALRELREGRKRSHWVWFVFPQVAGLGRSATAQHFALTGLVQARAYLAHPVLGPRLRECAQALAGLHAASPVDVLGGVDAQKVHSSMTLFALADPDEPVFREVLDGWYGGVLDPGTTSRV